MEILNPGILWGAFAVGIPILIHFWHQKKGKEILWAATRWLDERTLQKAKGFGLENLLLLILRSFLILLLVFILSSPSFFNSKLQKEHWVLPQKEVVAAFRFELEQALQRKEPMYWFNGQKITDLQQMPSFYDLQLGLNRISSPNNLELYLTNQDGFSKYPIVYVPSSFHLNIVNTTATRTPVVQDDKPILTLVETDSVYVNAALNAISKVNGVVFEQDLRSDAKRKYDLSFTSIPDTNAKVNVVSNSKSLPLNKMLFRDNIYYFEDSLTPNSSDLVFEGQLPELILEMISFKTSNRLSNSQVDNRFVRVNSKPKYSSLNSVLVTLFVLMLAIERFLSFKKNT